MEERRGEEMDESVRVFLTNKYCGGVFLMCIKVSGVYMVGSNSG